MASVNRYELPAQQQVANTYVDLPYKELLLAGQAQQADYDKLEASRNEWANKQWNNLSPDDERAKAKQAWLESETNKIADLYGKDYRQARQAFKTFEREAVKEFGKFGSIGAMEANYNAFQNTIKQEEDRLKAGKINADQFEKAKAYHMKKYTEQGGIGDDASNYQGISLERLVDTVNASELTDKYGKGIMSNITAFANVSKTPDGQYIFKNKGTGESVSPQEVQKIVFNYMKGDTDFMNYYQQGMKMGYTSEELLQSALQASVDKYAFDKNTYDEFLSGDPNYQYNDKKKIEQSLNAIPGTDVTQSGIETKNWAGQPVKTITTSGGYELDVKAKEQSISNMNNRIAEFTQIANNVNNTPEARKAAEVAANNLKFQQQQLASEVNTDKQIISSEQNKVINKLAPGLNGSINDLKLKTEALEKAEKELTMFQARNKGTNYNPEQEKIAIQAVQNLKQDLANTLSIPIENVNQALTTAKNITQELDKAVASYYANKITLTPTIQVQDNGKNPTANTLKNHMINNPDQYNFYTKGDDGKMKLTEAIKNPSIFPTENTIELANIVMDGKKTSMYVEKDKAGNVVRTLYASPKNPEALTTTYDNYFESLGEQGQFFKAANDNPELYKAVLSKSNQLTKNTQSSTTEKNITSEIPLSNGLKVEINVDGATSGKYNFSVYKDGKPYSLELPTGEVSTFGTTTSVPELFLYLNEFEKIID